MSITQIIFLLGLLEGNQIKQASNEVYSRSIENFANIVTTDRCKFLLESMSKRSIEVADLIFI